MEKKKITQEELNYLIDKFLQYYENTGKDQALRQYDLELRQGFVDACKNDKVSAVSPVSLMFSAFCSGVAVGMLEADKLK